MLHACGHGKRQANEHAQQDEHDHKRVGVAAHEGEAPLKEKRDAAHDKDRGDARRNLERHHALVLVVAADILRRPVGNGHLRPVHRARVARESGHIARYKIIQAAFEDLAYLKQLVHLWIAFRGLPLGHTLA